MHVIISAFENLTLYIIVLAITWVQKNRQIAYIHFMRIDYIEYTDSTTNGTIPQKKLSVIRTIFELKQRLVKFSNKNDHTSTHTVGGLFILYVGALYISSLLRNFHFPSDYSTWTKIKSSVRLFIIRCVYHMNVILRVILSMYIVTLIIWAFCFVWDFQK